MSTKTFMKLSPRQKAALQAIVAALYLLWWTLAGVSNGADLSDTLYNVGNFAFFRESSGSLHYAIYLANLLGHVIYRVGGSYLTINLLCRLVSVLTAAAVLLGMRRYVDFYLLLLCEALALGLSWSPAVVLYQHMSYLALTIGALLLYAGMMRRERRCLCLAGVVLGLSLFVRVSNLTYCALIVYVCYDDLRYRRGKLLHMDILACVGGYLGGAAAALLLMLLMGGLGGMSTMIDWITGLLDGSGGGGGYTMGEMLVSIADNYLGNLYGACLAVIGILLGTGMFMVRRGRLLWMKRVLYCCGILLLLIYYYRSIGAYDFHYYNVSSIFRISVIALWLLLFLDLWTLCDRRSSARSKGLALLALLVQLITPLGSNNHLYSCINDMYFIAPVGGYLAATKIRSLKSGHPLRFPLAAMLLSILALLLVQSQLFHLHYAFKDGIDGTPRDAVISAPSQLAGMHTGAAHAAAIHGVEEAVRGLYDSAPSADGIAATDASLPDTLLTYGDIPGFHYLLGLPTPISTTWPDLDSYPADDYRRELQALQEGGRLPLCILSRPVMDELLAGEDVGSKAACLWDFVQSHPYAVLYEDDSYVVLQPLSAIR